MQATLFTLDEGVTLSELSMPEAELGLPTHGQIMVPLLEVLSETKEATLPSYVYKVLADRFGLTQEQREATDPHGRYRLWDRRVRWVWQLAKLRGLANHPRKGLWELTDQGKAFLHTAKPGVMVPVFETPNGVVVCGDSLEVMSHVEKGTVNLFVVSPPYLTDEKAYGGTRDEEEYLERYLPFYSKAYDLTAPDGSLVINLGYHYTKGQPTLSLYQYDLITTLVRKQGWHYCGLHVWHNSAKMPAPANYVNQERIRCKISTEMMLWFGKSPRPKANNRNVLVPYSEAMEELLASEQKEFQVRPSGHTVGVMGRNEGAIPPNLLIAPNTASTSPYKRFCEEAGLPVHGARFPEELPEFWIKFLTDPGDLVVDFFFGSGTTGKVAERLGRRWIGIEQSLAYAVGAIGWFEDVPIRLHEPATYLLPRHLLRRYRMAA